MHHEESCQSRDDRGRRGGPVPGGVERPGCGAGRRGHQYRRGAAAAARGSAAPAARGLRVGAGALGMGRRPPRLDWWRVDAGPAWLRVSRAGVAPAAWTLGVLRGALGAALRVRPA